MKAPRVQDTIIVALPFSLEAQPVKWMIVNQLMDDYPPAYCHSSGLPLTAPALEHHANDWQKGPHPSRYTTRRHESTSARPPRPRLLTQLRLLNLTSLRLRLNPHDSSCVILQDNIDFPPRRRTPKEKLRLHLAPCRLLNQLHHHKVFGERPRQAW